MTEMILTVVLAAVVALMVGAIFLLPALGRMRTEHSGDTRTAEQILQSGEAPVVHLRPFTIVGRGSSDWVVFNTVVGFGMPTVDVDLAATLRDAGPLVTIGYPGERVIRDFSAARAQCPKHDWQPFIRRWMAAAKLLIVVIGPSNGAAWQIDVIKRNKYLPKTLFLINDAMGEPRELLSFLKTQLGGVVDPLDRELDGNCVLYFGSSRQATVVRENLGYESSRRAEALQAALEHWEQETRNHARA